MLSSESAQFSLVRRIVADELGLNIADVNGDLGLYGHPLWDSITHVNILIRLEAEGGLALSDELVAEATTVVQLAEKIRVTV